MREVDYTAMRRAADKLREALAKHAEEPENEFVRDALVQRFEFNYELAHALLRKFLETTSASGATVDRMTFPTLIRTGSERGLLLSGWDRWIDFRNARNATSHEYDEGRAMLAVALAPDFLREVEYLYRQMVEQSQ